MTESCQHIYVSGSMQLTGVGAISVPVTALGLLGCKPDVCEFSAGSGGIVLYFLQLYLTGLAALIPAEHTVFCTCFSKCCQSEDVCWFASFLQRIPGWLMFAVCGLSPSIKIWPQYISNLQFTKMKNSTEVSANSEVGTSPEWRFQLHSYT